MSWPVAASAPRYPENVRQWGDVLHLPFPGAKNIQARLDEIDKLEREAAEKKGTVP
ncbi:MAG TPA: hypothetical protein VFW15_01745 [Thermoanaerobaculia bacterium]|nr:hypothetical protein [Thermoanaerobaculia bacterium]